MFPLFGKQLSPEEIIERLEIILKESRESEKKGLASLCISRKPFSETFENAPIFKGPILSWRRQPDSNW